MLEIKDWHEMPPENEASSKWLKTDIKGQKATIEAMEASIRSRGATSSSNAEQHTTTEAPLDYISRKDVTHKDPYRVGSTILSKDSKRAKTKENMAASSVTKHNVLKAPPKKYYGMSEDDTEADITKSTSLIDQKMDGADHDGFKDNRDHGEVETEHFAKLSGAAQIPVFTGREDFEDEADYEADHAGFQDDCNLGQVDSKPSADVSAAASAAVFTNRGNPDEVEKGKANGSGCNGKHINTLEWSDEVNGGDVHGLTQAETPFDATHKEAEADHIVPENFPSAANNCARDGNGKHRNHDGKAKVKFNPTKVSKQVNKKDKKGDDTTLAEKVRAVFTGAQEGGGLGDHGGPKSANGSGMTTTPLSAKYED